MSFDYDPFHVMTIVLRESGAYSYLCDSCGGGWQIEMSKQTTIEQMRQAFDEHVKISHKYTPEDTKTWHKGH